jgi:archaellum component FlaG (FlaF/FlaG flagellin family)
MKTKLLIALALTMIALSLIGYSYACQNGGIHINCCQPNCNIKFTLATTSDNENTKEVATTTAQIINDGNTINAYISNGYPCYEAYITYTIKNTGNCPIHFTGVTITNPNPEALEITTTNHTCTWLQPCQTTQGTTTVHILQTAQQNWQYQFQIKITAECQTCQGKPRTIGFWKHQFSTATCTTKGNQQVDSATLERYLDQISAQSQIFEFTGTRKQKFQQALNILNPPGSSMQAKLKAQLLALWLNYAAGWTNGYTVNDKTAWQIIQGSENALLNNQTNKYEYWKNLCDAFNNIGG